MSYDGQIGATTFYTPAVYDDSVRVQINASVGADRSYEIVLKVSDNQPVLESIEEMSSTAAIIKVYNEYGVLVCDNSASLSGKGNQPQTDGHGEMASEPIDGTGAMI